MEVCGVFYTFVLFFDRYMFIEFTDANTAAEAVKTMDGYKFDKNHTLMVNLFTDFDKLVL